MVNDPAAEAAPLTRSYARLARINAASSASCLSGSVFSASFCCALASFPALSSAFAIASMVSSVDSVTSCWLVTTIPFCRS